jgi:hypothetical protein
MGYVAAGMQRALDSAIGLPRRSTSASWTRAPLVTVRLSSASGPRAQGWTGPRPARLWGLCREFRTRWAAHDVRLHRTGVKRLRHPVVGELTLSFETTPLPADQGLALTMLSARPDRQVTMPCACSPAGQPPARPAARSRHHRSKCALRLTSSALYTTRPGLLWAPKTRVTRPEDEADQGRQAGGSQ